MTDYAYNCGRATTLVKFALELATASNAGLVSDSEFADRHRFLDGMLADILADIEAGESE